MRAPLATVALFLAACGGEKIAGEKPPATPCDDEIASAIAQYGEPVSAKGDVGISGQTLTFVQEGDTIRYTFHAHYEQSSADWCEVDIQI